MSSYGYDPRGYVPGGATKRVALATQMRAGRLARPQRPYDPRAYVPGGSTPAVAQAIQAQGYGARAPIIRPRAVPGRGRPGAAAAASGLPGALPGVDPLWTQANSTISGMVSPLIKQLAAQRAAAEVGARNAYGAHAQGLEQALGRTAAPIDAAYGQAIRSSAATEEALANRLSGQGAAAGGDLGAKLAQIQASPGGASELQGVYQGAGNAGFAGGTADIQNLIGRQAEAKAYQRKLPQIARVESSRDLAQALSEMGAQFGERETDIQGRAIDQSFDLYRDLKGEKVDAANTAAAEKADARNTAAAAEQAALERQAKMNATLLALRASATTKAQEQAYDLQIKSLDLNNKKEIAQIRAQTSNYGADVRAKTSAYSTDVRAKTSVYGTDVDAKTAAIKAAATAKAAAIKAAAAAKKTVATNTAAAKGKGKSKPGGSNDSWVTAGSAKRSNVEGAGFESILRPNQKGFIRRSLSEGGSGIYVNTFNAVNTALIGAGLTPQEVMGQQGTLLRNSILARLVGKKYTDNQGSVLQVTPDDLRLFMGGQGSPKPVPSGGR